MKEKRLGRGLEALLDKFQTETVSDRSSIPVAGSMATKDIPLTMLLSELVPNPSQPRQDFGEEELEQLSQSILTHGIIEPIVVSQLNGQYTILAGERRYRAAQKAGLAEVPVRILENIQERQILEIALTENLQRKDLNAIEKAFSFASYLEQYGGTHEELARRLQLDRCTVTNLLRLLELPEELQNAVRQEKLSAGHIRALFSLEDYEKIEVAGKIIDEGWSVRETERFVQELVQTGESVSPRTEWKVITPAGVRRTVNGKKKSEQLLQLERHFRNELGGVKVQLTQNNDNGKGKLMISFANHQEFELIYSAICRSSRKVA